MTDPVSWFLIEPGWRVEAADGQEVGRVLEVTGDSNADIFDGLSIAFSMFDRPRYVPAEHVAEIVEGRVRLTLGRAEIERLEATAAEPTSVRKESLPLLRRILLWFGLTGRR
jgi:hypothetical protein